MNYDFTNRYDRKRFVKRANYLLLKKRENVCLVDESKRTPNQNSYIHVLCRILAQYAGTSETYAKQVYFKKMANKDIFYTVTKDAITGEMQKYIRSSAELTIPEMATAITNFIGWAADNGVELPKARLIDDGSENGKLVFETEKDAKAYHQAQIETSKQEFSYDTF